MKKAALVVSLFLLAPSVTGKGGYNRSVDDVAWAIGQSQPKMGLELRRSYARTILSESRKRNFDPFTLVAIGHNESRWNVRLIGGAENKCYGIGQHCVQFKYSVCRGEKYDSPECMAKRQWLLNGHNNIVETARDITLWRKYCKKLTGRQPLFRRWLYGYQGHSPGDRSRQCCMKKTRRGWKDISRPSLVRMVMNYRLKLDKRNRRRKR